MHRARITAATLADVLLALVACGGTKDYPGQPIPAKKLGKGQMPDQTPTKPGIRRESLIWRDEEDRMVFIREGKEQAMGLNAGGYVSPWTYADGEVTYGSPNHTNELVTLASQSAPMALGVVKGVEGRWCSFGKGVVDNTQLIHVVHRAWGQSSPAILKPSGK